MKTLNMQKMGGASQAGFTIIELVVVILLLGILTATALPRFLDISDEAHGAVVDAHIASLATAANLYRAGWYANQQPTTAGLYFDSGVALNPSLTGFPTGTTGAFASSHADCVAIFTNLMQTGGTALTATAVATATEGSTASLVTTPPGLILTGGADWNIATQGEFAAQWIDDDGTADATLSACDFYYMGQFQSATSTVRVIRFEPTSGLVTEFTSAALGTAI